MSSKGFEFAYSFDNSTPLIKDWPMVADAAGYVKGDLLICDSAGRADKAANGSTEAFAVCQETDADAVSVDDELKVAIVTRSQVWRCSMDATSTALIKGFDKTVDLVDENTVDADGSGSGILILLDTDTDDAGNVLAYVVFNNTTFAGTS
jgi:hypothetical protein